MPPTYRDRLRVEGLVLAGAGAIASVALLLGVGEASDRSASTISQLAFVALTIAVVAPLMTRRTLAKARPVEAGEGLTGKPTALWKPPLVLVALATPFIVAGQLGAGAGGWDAGLRVTGGCLLVGLGQAVLIERIVAADEARTRRTYVRLDDSSAKGGTTLGFFCHKQV